MSEGELFDVPEVKSPRLRWMEKHGLKTKHFPGVQDGEEDPETGYELHTWVAWRGSPPVWIRTGGATEDDALADWARANGVRMWNEEDL